MSGSCSWCGVDIAGNRKWCSERCREFSRGVDCGTCGRRMWHSAVVADVPVCNSCRRLVHGRKGYYRGCRCDVCRAGKAEREREYRVKQAASGVKRTYKTVDRSCENCGVEFQARVDGLKRGRGKFCSPSCSSSFNNLARLSPEQLARRDEVRELERVQGRRGSVRWRALKRLEASSSLSGGGRVFVQGACLVCGAEFMSAGAESRYCSSDCRRRNKRSSFGLTIVDRLAIYERDNWLCHLCGLEVDKFADVLSPLAATVDHVVPQSLGGSHDVENLRTAHRFCNSVRRDVLLDEFLTGDVVTELRERLGVVDVAC